MKLHDIYESEQYVHLVLENFNIPKLVKFIIGKANYSENDAMKLMKSLLKTIDDMHSENILYRNFNLDNIYVKYYEYNNSWKDQSIKFGNMAVAKQLSGSTVEVDICGFPGYMAPEVVNKGGYGLKSDIYSCGIILYIMYFILNC